VLEKEPLKVLFVATEVAPYCKSGGLGDVAGSLPQALRERGADVRVVFPKYGGIKPVLLERMRHCHTFAVHLSWRVQNAAAYVINDDADAPFVYLIENDYYFGRDGYYGFGDDYERFAFFTKAAIEMLSHVSFKADVIHFNDWQTGLGCTYLSDIYRSFTFYANMKSLFTIHNLHYQGVFGRDVLWSVGLNDGYFTNGELEFHGNISYLKAGLIHSDAVSTVSETYAAEIQTPYYGYGMDGLLRKRGKQEGRLFGITNGIDVTANNPETDARLFASYGIATLSRKKNNKYELQKALGLPVGDAPMLGIISRLVSQKGFDIISIIMDELLGKDVQLVVLGTGEERYEHMFQHYAWRYPEKISANIMFSDSLAQQIYAGSDLFLVPSVYEPCGLTQLFAMRYGTIPVVRKTGGLADTVQHYNPETREGNGFVFEDYLASGLMWAINQALAIYGTSDWDILMQNAMKGDFSWDSSAAEYMDMYEKIIKG
jgi:starch synthase